MVSPETVVVTERAPPAPQLTDEGGAFFMAQTAFATEAVAQNLSGERRLTRGGVIPSASPQKSAAQIDDFYVQTRAGHFEEDIREAQQILQADCYRLRSLHTIARRIDTIVDVDGKLGYFALLAKSLWPHASLIALDTGNTGASSSVSWPVSWPLTRSDFSSEAKRDDFFAGDLYQRNLDANGIEDVTFLEGGLEGLLSSPDFRGNCLLKLPPAFPRISLPAAAKVEVVIGEFQAELGFETFGRNARRAFPHLYFYECPNDVACDVDASIAPYWGFPSLPFAFGFFGLERARRLFCRRRTNESRS